MPRRPSYRPPALSLQRHAPPNASSTAPSSVPDFQTQVLPDSSPRIIRSTQLSPRRASDRRQVFPSSRRVDSRSATPSRRPEEENEGARADPQAPDPKRRSPHNESKDEELDAEVSSTLNHSSQSELLDAQRDLLAAQRDLFELWTKTKGLSEKFVHTLVIQAVKSYFPNLKCCQSEPIGSQGSTTGLDGGNTKRLPDADDLDTSALAFDDSSRDAVGGQSLREGTSSRLTRPNKEGPTKQIPALPAIEKGKSKAARRLNLRDLKDTINSRSKFRETFEDWQLDAIGAGNFVIGLLELAKETVNDVNPKFQQRLRDAGEQGHQRNRWRRQTHITEEIWQVLFTIVANMFVYGVEPLYKTVHAAFSRSKDLERLGSSRHVRRNGGNSNNGVTGTTSNDTPLGFVDWEKVEELTGSLLWWRTKVDKSQNQMNKVCDRYKKLQTVRLYDTTMELWKNNEEDIQEFGRVKGYHRLDAATFLLSYIAYKITPSRKEETNDNNDNSDNNDNTDNDDGFDILPEDSEILREISDMILRFRPISSLAEAFGDGVLLLMVDKAEKYVPGVVGEGQEHYPQHERIRDVALSICEVDRRMYNGQLRKQFADLEEKVLGPVLLLSTGGDISDVVFDYPKRCALDRVEVGQRISYILGQIVLRGSTVQQGAHRSKRRISHSSIEQSGGMGPGRGPKRHRATSSEDGAASSEDGAAANEDGEAPMVWDYRGSDESGCDVDRHESETEDGNDSYRP